MDKPFQFTDDWSGQWAEIQLTDLCIALSRTSTLNVQFEPVSRVKSRMNAVAISTIYGEFDPSERFRCQQADAYLRCLGTIQHREMTSLQAIRSTLRNFISPNLAVHVFCAIDDQRHAMRIQRDRPGTPRAFAARIHAYLQILEGGRPARERTGAYADLWFTDWYRRLNIPGSEMATAASQCATPDAVLRLTQQVLHEFQTAAERNWPDLTLRLFDLDDSTTRSAEADADTQTERRSADLPRTDDHEGATDRSTEGAEEQVEIWTQRQETNQAFALEMPMDDGQAGSATNDGGRLSNQSSSQMQVRRGRSNEGSMRHLEDAEDETSLSLPWEDELGSGANVDVMETTAPMGAEQYRDDVLRWEQATAMVRRRLRRVFSSAFEQSRTFASDTHQHGRLGKHLERIAFEPSPRLFYRKELPNATFDAVVHLLVDCSGSMYRYLDACKPFIYLVHETLRQLQIVHGITGFWEDTDYANGVFSGRSTTYLSHVIPYHASLQHGSATNIGRLEPQLDNRDGLAIRAIAKHMLFRPERQKWLWMVSDAQPAAENYRNAVEDTKRAIHWATQRNIHVVHISILASDDHGMADMVRRLYGRNTIVIDDVHQLASRFEHVLRDILKSVAEKGRSLP